MNWLNRSKWSLAGIVIGAAAGYAYWYYVGCAGGTCAITSRPLNSTVYGALIGFLLFGLFDQKKEDART